MTSITTAFHLGMQVQGCGVVHPGSLSWPTENIIIVISNTCTSAKTSQNVRSEKDLLILNQRLVVTLMSSVLCYVSLA